MAATTGLASACARRDDVVTGRALPYPYGGHAAQVADLHLPDLAAWPEVQAVVVTIHGGFWSSAYDRTLEDAVVADLVAGGYAVWNLDYRSVGDGGGWPRTFEDVAAGLDALLPACVEHGLPADRVALVGHSAGGHLALWGGARHRLPDTAPGAPGRSPSLRPVALVSQAGVNDLRAAHDDDLGDGAVEALMGGPPDDRYRLASPAELLPTGVPTLLVTGELDDRVPPSQSREYAERARAAGDDADLVVVEGEGHFQHLDTGSAVWTRTRTWLDERLRS